MYTQATHKQLQTSGGRKGLQHAHRRRNMDRARDVMTSWYIRCVTVYLCENEGRKCASMGVNSAESDSSATASLPADMQGRPSTSGCSDEHQRDTATASANHFNTQPIETACLVPRVTGHHLQNSHDVAVAANHILMPGRNLYDVRQLVHSLMLKMYWYEVSEAMVTFWKGLTETPLLLPQAAVPVVLLQHPSAPEPTHPLW